MNDELTHLDQAGRAQMVDVSKKPPMYRRAQAEGFFCCQASTLDRVMEGDLPKGEVLAVARIAGINAAKQCDRLIPLAHSLRLDQVAVHFERAGDDRLRVRAEAVATGPTGVEMEALTAVSVACLTLYDMTKGVDRQLHLQDIRLVSKEKTPI